MIKERVSTALKFLRVDWSYLSGGYFIFQLQMVLYVVVDVGLLAGLNALKVIANPTITFERMSLIFAFTGVIATVTQEFKGQYTDPIQLLFGTWRNRYLTRIFTTSLLFSLVFDLLIVLFSRVGESSPFHVNLTLKNLVGYNAALLLIITLGVYLAFFLKATFLANFLPPLIIVLETSVGGITKGASNKWTFTGLFLPLLRAQSTLHLLAAILLYGLAGFTIASLLTRNRTRIEDKLNIQTDRKFRLRSTPGDSISWRMARAIERRNHDLGIRFAQLFTNVQFLRLPILFLWIGVLPLINNKVLQIHAPERIILPIIAASTIQSILFIALISPSILENKEFIENELILFRSKDAFRAATERLWQIICSAWGLLIVALAVLIYGVRGGHVDYLFSLRPVLVATLLAPIFVSFAFVILRLPVDPRFFPVFAIVYYVLDSVILNSIPHVSRYAPSGLIANLAGGRGLYQILMGESGVSAPWIAAFLALAVFMVAGVRRVRERSLVGNELEAPSLS